MPEYQDISTLLSQHSRPILYFPLLNQVTGHALASILLQQILFRQKHQGSGPFYKFAAPCDHPAYRQGDSWQEELGFSRTEFETARRRIGQKVSRGKKKKEIQAAHLVSYWTDSQRLTWYDLNEALLLTKLQTLVKGATASFPGNAEILQYLGNDDNLHSLGTVGKPPYLEDAANLPCPMQEKNITLFTEKTSKKTTESLPAHPLSALIDEKTTEAASDEPTAVPLHQHPAIAGWREITKRYPRQENWALIIQRLGQNPDLTKLQNVITAWLGSGYRPDNVLGILDWYDRDPQKPSQLQSNGNASLARPKPASGDSTNSVGLIPQATLVGGRF